MTVEQEIQRLKNEISELNSSDKPELQKMLMGLGLSSRLQTLFFHQRELGVQRQTHELMRQTTLRNRDHSTIMMCIQEGVEWRDLAGVPIKKKTFIEEVKYFLGL